MQTASKSPEVFFRPGIDDHGHTEELVKGLASHLTTILGEPVDENHLLPTHDLQVPLSLQHLMKLPPGQDSFFQTIDRLSGSARSSTWQKVKERLSHLIPLARKK